MWAWSVFKVSHKVCLRCALPYQSRMGVLLCVCAWRRRRRRSLFVFMDTVEGVGRGQTGTKLFEQVMELLSRDSGDAVYTQPLKVAIHTNP